MHHTVTFFPLHTSLKVENFQSIRLRTPLADSIYVKHNMLSICIGCIIAKTNIVVCVVGTNVPTCV